MAGFRDSLRRLPKAPAEGWLSLICILVLTLTVAWSIDDAAWVLGRDKFTDFLALTVGWGILIGFIGGKSGLGRWPTYLLGAILAALVVPLYVGDVLIPDAIWLDQYKATAGSVVDAWRDLAIRNQAVTQQYGHFLLTLGLFTWATAMYAGYTTFGHRRPLNAIVLVGLVLVVNMGFTYNNQLTLLVVFSLAALFLLIRFHAFDEESEWLRRRIGDPSAVSALYLRGGSVFIAVAVGAAFLLTQTASSAPLAGAVRGVGDQLINFGQDFQRFLPTGGANRPLGVQFGTTAQISGQWTSSSEIAFSVQFSEPEDEHLYWRAAVYDEYDVTAWRQSVTAGFDVPAQEQVLQGTSDAVREDGRRAVTFTVVPDDFRASTVLSPQGPAKVSVPVRVSYVDESAKFVASIDRNGGDPYTVTALVRQRGDADDGEITINKLRAAGTVYPPAIARQYLQVPDGAIPSGGAAEQLLEDILATVPDPDNPYDVASAMVDYLQSSTNFTYDTDVRNLPCEGLSTVECFARFKHGYCQYYATTMAILLREHGIPTRLAAGYLPGLRDGRRFETVRFSAAHAWVEVYFPGYGWVEFDPTGGGIAAAEPLPTGEPVASRPPQSAASLGPIQGGRGELEGDQGPLGDGGSNVPFVGAAGSSAALIVIALLLAIVVGAVAFIAWRRGPRGEVTPDRAYAQLTRLASRLGFGPRPTQTVYEYAGVLSEVLPQSRPEIQMVAQAKVEVAYGRRMLGDDRMAALREAQRRLRVGLLRLLFRRGPRGRIKIKNLGR
jgi:transglutaminase-like putative cysteine protease